MNKLGNEEKKKNDVEKGNKLVTLNWRGKLMVTWRLTYLNEYHCIQYVLLGRAEKKWRMGKRGR